MEAVRHHDGVEDVDVGRQFVVQALDQRVGRQAGRDIEMGDLRERVDAGIGPPRSVQLEIHPRVTVRTARSISPCTVLAFFWICQPLYRVPAYSMVSLKRGIERQAERQEVAGRAGRARRAHLLV